MEEADREFFLRVERGYQAIAKGEPDRVKLLDATKPVPVVADSVWKAVEDLIKQGRSTLRSALNE
jgi:thymidylate kinase